VDKYEKIDDTLASPFGISFELRAVAPVQLSGIGGQTILAQVASTNITNQVTKSNCWRAVELGRSSDEQSA
jgi:hypothetical protein